MIQVTLHKNFIKRYGKLSSRIRARVDERLLLFQADSENPILNMHPLQGERQGYWSINIGGNLRIVFRMLENGIVQLKDLGTHSELYD